MRKNMLKWQNISNNHENIENFLYTPDEYMLSHRRSCLGRPRT